MGFLIIAGLVGVIDQVIKYFVTLNIANGQDISFIPGIVHLTNIQNRGAAFSMLSNYTWLLTIISAVGIAVLAWLIFSKSTSRLEKILLSLALGGAIGNFIDRALLGYVVDMFELEFMNFAIFNFADICLNIGGIGFGIAFLIDIIKEEKAKKTESASELSEENSEEQDEENREERD